MKDFSSSFALQLSHDSKCFFVVVQYTQNATDLYKMVHETIKKYSLRWDDIEERYLFLEL